MESSTSQAIDQPPDAAEWQNRSLLKENWGRVLAMLPDDLDRSARQYKALLRRRGIAQAADLLRLAFFYGLADWSLRQIGMWANLLGVCDLSDVAILHRLRSSRAWLGALVVEMLRQRGIRLQASAKVRLRILDATVITQPGSQGTDWRLHLSLDLGSMSLDQLAVTDAHGGEGFGHFSFDPETILLADSVYAHTRSLEQPLLRGAKLVVREQWNTRPVADAQGKPFDIIAWLKRTFPTGSTEPAETPVWLPTSQGLIPFRLVACPLPPEQAEKARERARKKSRKKKHQPYAKNLFAVGFVVLLTNLSVQPWSSAQVLALYRWRWQIELYIKRLKSLLEIDRLRTQDPELAQTYLLTKLLAAILVDTLRSGTAEQVPDLFDQVERPISVWRLDVCLIHTLSAWVLGELPTLERFHQILPRLRRYLCNAPRKRRQQLSVARSQLAAFCAC